MDKEMAYNLGRECGLNGADTINSNIRIFSQTEFTESWTKGRDDALSEKKNPAHFCDCGKFLGHRGFCSDECHNKHYDAKSEDSEVKR